jgi:hypothetical protein
MQLFTVASSIIRKRLYALAHLKCRNSACYSTLPRALDSATFYADAFPTSAVPI